jgi:hypothetical protein
MKSLFANLQSIPYEENSSVAKPQMLHFAVVNEQADNSGFFVYPNQV